MNRANETLRQEKTMSLPSRHPLACLALSLTLAAGAPSPAQTFDSGSDGSDGPLSFETNAGLVLFDPQQLGIDADRDNVFHFTTITVPVGTKVRLRSDVLGGEGKPVVWLATGAVRIDGVLDLSGGRGHDFNAPHLASIAGAGGYNGGIGGTVALPPTPGSGPGAGAARADLHGGSAGHILAASSVGTAAGGSAYGNRFLLPPLGGSGGGGGGVSTVDGSGGGAGGGALVIASSTSITITTNFNLANIDASGGKAGAAVGLAGGSGSGGAIRLIAPVVAGNGRLNVLGGDRPNFPGLHAGADGRVRIEAFRREFTGRIFPASSVTTARPGLIFLPDTAPRVVVTTVGGVLVSPGPTGSFEMPDAVIESDEPVTIEISAQNIPPGTQVELTISPEDGNLMKLMSTPLEGTRESSTATVSGVTFPHGFTRVVVVARWGP